MTGLLEALPYSERVSEKPSPASPVSPDVTCDGEAGEAADDSSSKFASREAGPRSSAYAIRGCPEHDRPTDIREGSRALDQFPARAALAPMSSRRCGALICCTCHVLSPSPHREGCAFPRFEPSRSRWYWLSPHGAIKCVACSAPADLGLVEAWVLARETGEGEGGWRIPGEILSLLHVASPAQ